MIKITKAKEIRQRDIKRDRLLFTLGNNHWHITREEALKLQKQLNKVLR